MPDTSHIFKENPTEKTLFERTIAENDQALVVWSPVDWLIAIANPNPSDKTTLSNDGPEEVDLETLYRNMLERGMSDPLVISFGVKTGRYRLDEGNQRVRIFKSKGIGYVPVIGVVAVSHIIQPRNGLHDGDVWPISDPTPEEGMISPILALPDAPLSSV